ncbi:MAG: Ig-like domain-containing protein [Bacteroidetes bacterium]|nr:Ig-like domain-containing protein [Bacteroidota bacterium]
MRKLFALFLLPLVFSCAKNDQVPQSKDPFTILNFELDGKPISYKYTNTSTSPAITLYFSEPVDRQSAEAGLIWSNNVGNFAVNFTYSHKDSVVSVTPVSPLDYWSTYYLTVSPNFLAATKKPFDTGFYIKIITQINPAPKFPTISDDELLTLTQKKTFQYFYDFAHPASGMARERNTSGNTVTTGGTGFGLMALLVGIERNFITRQQGIQQVNKIVTFLEKADRFHGAWSHWIDGSNGKVIPFSTKDNGGDLVETSFLVQGLLTVRQYLQPADTVGNNLIKRINTLWETVEWDWYRKNNEQVLYWHWSPNYNWDMNFAMYGYFEEQITYVLAAASPTHSIPKSVYSNGYGKNGGIKTGNTYYGIKLPLGTPSPLFWVHYSYLGLDPHFSDDYANYWDQNVNASKINYAYCVANPKKYPNYGESCWGLTSSDNQVGYNAHSPSNDLGVITPTAALSSFPYTPVESMKALKFFYYTMGDKLWGTYGFYDAFNISEAWTANSYLAIDQGPIVVMIENHRTGMLWNLFMSAPEIQSVKTKLNFTP